MIDPFVGKLGLGIGELSILKRNLNTSRLFVTYSASALEPCVLDMTMAPGFRRVGPKRGNVRYRWLIANNECGLVVVFLNRSQVSFT